MCRLLIHNVAPPLHPTDDLLNAGMFQVGHVVAIIEDGESFGSGDLEGHCEVVEVAGVDKQKLEHLLTGQTVDVERVATDRVTKADVTSTVSIPVAARMWKVTNVKQLKSVSGLMRVAKGAELAFTNSYFQKTVDLPTVKAALAARGEVVK